MRNTTRFLNKKIHFTKQVQLDQSIREFQREGKHAERMKRVRLSRIAPYDRETIELRERSLAI